MMPEWMSQDFELFDTHAHLNDDGCPDEAAFYRRAEEAGVPWLLLCGSDYESSRRAAEFASHFGRVYLAAGLHPLEVLKHPCEAEKFEAFADAPTKRRSTGVRRRPGCRGFCCAVRISRMTAAGSFSTPSPEASPTSNASMRSERTSDAAAW